MAAEKTLSKINMDEWRWIIQGQIEGRKRDYTSGLLAAERRGIAKGHASGLAEGELRGARQAAIANARNALNMGLSPEQASQITALSLEQVLKLREKMKTES